MQSPEQFALRTVLLVPERRAKSPRSDRSVAMSSSPEDRSTATVLIEEPSPQVNHPQLEKGSLAETAKPPLPAGLLGSSPEIGNTG
jgi:hypothetical protein